MSAMPEAYSSLSSMTATVLAFSFFSMYLAAAGPWALSLPTARWKYFQPLSASVGLVADAVMLTMPACSKMGSALLDSPEKAGPTTATVLSEMTFWASWGAWAAVALAVVLEQVDLGLALLVVLVDRQLLAVVLVDAELGVGSGQGAEEPDLDGPAAGAVVALVVLVPLAADVDVVAEAAVLAVVAVEPVPQLDGAVVLVVFLAAFVPLLPHAAAVMPDATNRATTVTPPRRGLMSLDMAISPFDPHTAVDWP